MTTDLKDTAYHLLQARTMANQNQNKSVYAKMGVGDPFDPACQYVTSPIFSPGVLGGIRSTFAFYTLLVLVYLLVHEAVIEHNADSCVFFFF
jgi:hypothetical protein